MRKVTSRAHQAPKAKAKDYAYLPGYESIEAFKPHNRAEAALAARLNFVFTDAAPPELRLLLVLRCALAHMDELAPFLEADLMYCMSEDLDPSLFWWSKMHWKGGSKYACR